MARRRGGIEAAKNGFDAIMVPAGYLYFDYYQSEAVEKEPFAICCPSPIEKTYSFEPLEGIPAKAQKHILGVQANLWTEYISTPAHAEYMVLPRMDALSELQWCQPERKDYERFKEGVARMMRIYDALGYSYSRNIFGEPGLPGYTGPLGQ
ncbi:MAG: family 20 glycosylhydrolase [Bacteroidales bacterium]|nr:family 20 glycosylhydrolase [Bacteroidales bacterium]